MNILFLTLAYPEGKDERNIYTDLMKEFRDRGNEVYVVCQRERRYSIKTQFNIEDGISVLRARTGNFTKTNVIEKGISMLLIERQFIDEIKKYISAIKFDLVLYSTPPITFEKVVKYVKKRNNCLSYLLLKDIFPQNAVDLGLLNKKSFILRYFRNREKKLYMLSDYIGCMSPGNVKYLREHNSEIDPNKIEVCPNSIKLNSLRNLDKGEKSLRKKYNIPLESTVFIFGGNLGKPQGIDFLIDVLKNAESKKDAFFLIIGSGTEYNRLKSYFDLSDHTNSLLLKSLPKSDYDKLIEECDVGLIFLDHRFTIPNIPSRITAYMEAAIPILAATDVNTDLKDIIEESDCGMWVKNGDLDAFLERVNILMKDNELRKSMGINGRNYLEKHFTVSESYEIITSHLNNWS